MPAFNVAVRVNESSVPDNDNCEERYSFASPFSDTTFDVAPKTNVTLLKPPTFSPGVIPPVRVTVSPLDKPVVEIYKAK